MKTSKHRAAMCWREAVDVLVDVQLLESALNFCSTDKLVVELEKISDCVGHWPGRDTILIL